jgi:hypothetical protein
MAVTVADPLKILVTRLSIPLVHNCVLTGNASRPKPGMHV